MKPQKPLGHFDVTLRLSSDMVNELQKIDDDTESDILSLVKMAGCNFMIDYLGDLLANEQLGANLNIGECVQEIDTRPPMMDCIESADDLVSDFMMAAFEYKDLVVADKVHFRSGRNVIREYQMHYEVIFSGFADISLIHDATLMDVFHDMRDRHSTRIVQFGYEVGCNYNRKPTAIIIHLSCLDEDYKMYSKLDPAKKD